MECKLLVAVTLVVYMCRNSRAFNSAKSDGFQMIKGCDRLVIGRFSDLGCKIAKSWL